MGLPQHDLHRSFDQYLLVGENGDTVADRMQAVQIVGDHEDRQSQRRAQSQDQLVERRRADRIEAGRGLVEEQDLGIERERAGQSGALTHPAGELSGILGRGIHGQADHTELQRRDLVDQTARQVGVFAERYLDVLGHGEEAKERSTLKQHAPAFLEPPHRRIRALRHPLIQDLDRPGRAPDQPDDRAQQNRLAGPGAADDAENLAAYHVEIETVVDDLGAETRGQAADPDDRAIARARHPQTPT